ncbi:MAG TPA: class I SAM-dependent methyltransferase [Sphingomicrobium sp.]|nr:class I SAM-dependent methyltransferase [Sphingomicrobium sp.]
MSHESMLSKGTHLLSRLLTSSEARRRIPRAVWRAAKGPEPVFLDYPIDPRPRYGYGLPPHPELYALIDSNRSVYMDMLRSLERYAAQLSAIRQREDDAATEPHWRNGYIPGLDALTLYCFAAMNDPSLYVEIGSGNSTKFVRRSITDNHLHTKIVSIDPTPRAEIDSICDEVIREPLENLDFALFDRLGAGDILVFDGSHMVFQNSDATAFFLEIMPRLASGVMVYVDDIFLPYDYPPEWRERFYSEQYILGALLLGDEMNRYEVTFPNVFIDSDEELSQIASALCERIGLERKPGNLKGPHGRSGTGMWLRIRERGKAGR